MTAPDSSGRRHIVANPVEPPGDIARMLREDVPERAGKVPTRRLPG